MESVNRIRPKPCQFCPYRQDCPSGVWAKEEYEKLPPYDAETWAQPHEAFACHEATGLLCSGWAQCHGEELLSLRLERMRTGENFDIPAPSVPLFASGREAAEHGMRDVKKPDLEARAAVVILRGKRAKRALTKKRTKCKGEASTTPHTNGHRKNQTKARKKAGSGHPNGKGPKGVAHSANRH